MTFDAPPFLAALNSALQRFRSIHINDLSERYKFYPSEDTAKLGSGSYGDAYRVRAVDADVTREPLRVAKVILKTRVARNATQVQHLCAELAVSGILNHPHLNHRVGLFHNDDKIFVILELCGGPRPDPVTRVAHLLAYRRPGRLGEIDSIMQKWKDQAKEAGVNPEDETAFGDWIDASGVIKNLAAEVGVNLARDSPELPVGNDLFNFIVAYRRIPELMSQVILRQVLQGLDHLHSNQIVHRDMKTENVVIGIIRKSILRRDADGTVVGVTFFEKIDSKVIDFGLVKYMNITNAESPGEYIRATASPQAGPAAAPTTAAATEAPAAAKKENGNDDEDDDDEEDAGVKWGDAAKNLRPVQQPPTAGSANAFNISVTPCGTEIYCSLEALNGILQAGMGQHRAKWVSDKNNLPKMDIFGVGACLYCMSNGKPPFRPPETYRRISREERMRQIERLVSAGPVFIPSCSEASKALTQKLMDNDVRARLSAVQALQDPFVNHSYNVVVTDISIAGPGSTTLANEFPTTPDSKTGTATSTVSPSTNSPACESNRTTTLPTATPHPSDVGEDRRETSVVSNADGASPDRDENGEDAHIEAINDVMEALRNKEDDGDAAGKPTQEEAKKEKEAEQQQQQQPVESN